VLPPHHKQRHGIVQVRKYGQGSPVLPPHHKQRYGIIQVRRYGAGRSCAATSS
jgi:hypothetical protein